MNILRSLALVAVATAAASVAHATAYINDNFSSSPYVAGPLIGQDNWVITGTSVLNPIAISSGNAVLTTTGQDVDQPFIGGNLSTTGLVSIYTVANITVTAAGTGDYFLHLSVGPGNSSLFFERLFVRADATSGFDLGVLATSGNTGPVSFGSSLPFNTPLTVVVAWDFNAGPTNDAFSIYVNPADIRANDTAYTSIVWNGTTAEPTELGSVNFRQGTTGAAPSVLVTSLGVTDAFPVASSVPEPAVYAALFGGTVLGVASWRRVRRRI